MTIDPTRAEIIARCDSSIKGAKASIETFANRLLEALTANIDPNHDLRRGQCGIVAAADLRAWSVMREMAAQGTGLEAAKAYAQGIALAPRDPFSRSSNPVSNLMEDAERSAWRNIHQFLAGHLY